MKPIEVSQLNRYIKSILQNDPVLSRVEVVGEISNLKYHGTGHVYFSLKDSGSTVKCFLPRSEAKRLDFLLEEGMQVVVSSYVYLYEKGGYYSLNITDIRPEGEGSLAAAFEKLKKKLEAEGFFDIRHKKPLPLFPKRVGICTADTGAAIQDMIRTIKNKNNVVDIVLCPCKVQGDGAAADIAKAITALESMENKPDVIIVGRGGGSMEDLWAFNEEVLARAIYGCTVPVISAVGHETDFTIADFVADMRAATPTAAAEAAVPDIRDLEAELGFMMEDSERQLRKRIDFLETRVNNLSPYNLLKSLQNRVLFMEAGSKALFNDAAASLRSVIQREEAKVERAMSIAESLNPEHIMSLGYGAVSRADGKFVKSVADVKPGDGISIRVKDGTFEAEVKSEE